MHQREITSLLQALLQITVIHSLRSSFNFLWRLLFPIIAWNFFIRLVERKYNKFLSSTHFNSYVPSLICYLSTFSPLFHRFEAHPCNFSPCRPSQGPVPTQLCVRQPAPTLSNSPLGFFMSSIHHQYPNNLFCDRGSVAIFGHCV